MIKPLFAALYFGDDAIAGGVGWSYPFSDAVVGDYYVPPRWWIPLNFICALATYSVFRLIPMCRKLRRDRVVLDQKRSRTLKEVGCRSGRADSSE